MTCKNHKLNFLNKATDRKVSQVGEGKHPRRGQWGNEGDDYLRSLLTYLKLPETVSDQVRMNFAREKSYKETMEEYDTLVSSITFQSYICLR